jgi:predicted DNA-binding transcriptional regulator YafY
MPKEYGKTGTPLQSTRHAWIIERLNSGDELSITALANEWGISAKTLQRDFEKLTQMLPGFIERAPDAKRFRKATSYHANNDEELVIEMLEGMAQDIGGSFYTKAHQLLKQLRQEVSTPYYMRIGVEDISEKFELIRFLETAIQKRNSIAFDYRRWYDDKGELKHYEQVKPLKIIIFEGFWYLLVEHESHYKKFYLKSIDNCIMNQEGFTLSKEMSSVIENSLGIWFNPDVEPFEVSLHVEKDILIYFDRKPISKTQKLYKKSDGTAELILKITDKRELFAMMKYWLPHLRVLEPVALQEEFEGMMQKYLEV